MKIHRNDFWSSPSNNLCLYYRNGLLRVVKGFLSLAKMQKSAETNEKSYETVMKLLRDHNSNQAGIEFFDTALRTAILGTADILMKKDLPKCIRILRKSCKETNLYGPFKAQILLKLAELVFKLSQVEWDNPNMIPARYGNNSLPTSKLSETLLLLTLHNNLIKQPLNAQPSTNISKEELGIMDSCKKRCSKMVFLGAALGKTTDLLFDHAEEEVKEDQSSGVRWYNLALAAYADHRLEDALRACRHTFRGDVKVSAAECPENLDATTYLQYIQTSACVLASKLAIKLKRYKDAIVLSRAAVRLSIAMHEDWAKIKSIFAIDHRPTAYMYFGKACLYECHLVRSFNDRKSLQDLSIRALTKACNIAPDRPEIIFLLACAKAVVRELSDSFDLCRHLLLKDNWCSAGWHLLALLHTSRKNYEEAINAITRAFHVDDYTKPSVAKNQRLRIRLSKAIIMTKAWLIDY
jgi:tetratricopeptide (TPR) repeat protein